MQKNDYLLAKFGVDTAENEPLRARLRARLNIGMRIIENGIFEHLAPGPAEEATAQSSEEKAKEKGGGDVKTSRILCCI